MCYSPRRALPAPGPPVSIQTLVCPRSHREGSPFHAGIKRGAAALTSTHRLSRYDANQKGSDHRRMIGAPWAVVEESRKDI